MSIEKVADLSVNLEIEAKDFRPVKTQKICSDAANEAALKQKMQL